MFNTKVYPSFWPKESKLCSQITELCYRDVQHWSLPFILTQRASCAVWSQSFATEMFNTEAYPLYWHREQAVQSDHRALLQRCSTLKLTLYTDTESKLCSLITELCYRDVQHWSLPFILTQRASCAVWSQSFATAEPCYLDTDHLEISTLILYVNTHHWPRNLYSGSGF